MGVNSIIKMRSVSNYWFPNRPNTCINMLSSTYVGKTKDGFEVHAVTFSSATGGKELVAYKITNTAVVALPMLGKTSNVYHTSEHRKDLLDGIRSLYCRKR